MKRILVIAAHPDDEVLGCGGSIPHWIRQGHEVAIMILGEGATSRTNQREETDPALVAALQETSRKAAWHLGVTQWSQHGLPDNRFDQVDLLDVVKIMEQKIAEFKPTAVYTQHGGDLNLDHVITYRATLIATRPMEGCVVQELYAYEVASSTEWAFQQFQPHFHPNVFVDIADTLELKIGAMQAYESEARPFPHPRSPEALRAIAQHWGRAAGLKAAEPFQLVRKIES